MKIGVNEFLVLMGLAFVLGLKHAFEPDHLAAVSTIASRTREVRLSSVSGMSWGIGHGICVCLAGFVLLALRVSVPNTLSVQFDRVVGVMLIGLGLWTYLRVTRTHLHRHEHDGRVHIHLHSHAHASDHRHVHQSLAVGMAHGLLGSGALVVLALAATADVWTGIAYLVIFGIGVVISMGLIAGLMGLPFMTRRGQRLATALQLLAGTASLMIGLSFALTLGLVSGG